MELASAKCYSWKTEGEQKEARTYELCAFLSMNSVNLVINKY
jgi:hypothetical protein